ncbi:hypothetical protein EJB05_21305, partial [Eragrostis curvula]
MGIFLLLSSDAASREREKFKDDLIKAIKHEYQMIHETLDNYAAGQSMQTAEQVKERYGHNDPKTRVELWRRFYCAIYSY